MGNHEDRRQGLERLRRAPAADERRALCSRAVQDMLEEIRAGFAQGAAPAALLRALAGRYDELIRALFAGVGGEDRPLVALVALGGYGRGELYPHSDIDILLLHQGTEEQLLTELVEGVLYPLWDAGVAVGHAVRSIEQSLELAAEDLTARTSLLDARLLAGDEGPFHALQAGALREFFGPRRVGAFVAALVEEREARHRRFGETEYLLEPNVKNSKGGLRDLNTGLWAAKGRFGVDDLAGLERVQAATPRQLAALAAAQRFLQRLRLAMHLERGRAQDQLRFDLQEALAPRLCPEASVPGVQAEQGQAAVGPAVERLMHAFYRHARAVVLETDGILERCRHSGEAPTEAGEPLSDRAGEHLQRRGRLIGSADPRRFWEAPAEIIRAFRVMADSGLSLDRLARDAIAEAVAEEPGAQLAVDEAAVEQWLGLLADPEPGAGGTVLEQMHHTGVLSALIPELEPCTGRIQHDLYHVYTVDQHSLYVVALLKAWLRGELADRYPMPVAVMSRVQGSRALMLGALLHDVGKPLGRSHAVKGARLARGVAARLGLPGEEQETVTFLVRHHLLMAHLSQRRDLSDPEVIGSFSDTVRSVDRLRQLYLLTAADTAMTAPGNLSAWKAALLDELFIRAYAHLAHGGAAAPDLAHLEDKRDQVGLALRRAHGPGGEGLASRIPRQMLLAFSIEDLAHHLGAVVDLDAAPGARVQLRHRPGWGRTTELTLCCDDFPGLLALVTGVMVAHRVQVLAAQVHTLEPAARGAPGRALDVFTVETEAPDPDALWGAFEADLRRAVDGDLAVPELVSRHTRPSTLAPRAVPRVPTEVSVDNAASGRFTVVEVQAPDRLGVLYAITDALSRLGLTIHLSRVATEAGRVIDIFYVSEEGSGGKVTGDGRIAEVERAVAEAIEALVRPRR